MARHECCREIETAIFAARTNLPVLDFQTWQVWTTHCQAHAMLEPCTAEIPAVDDQCTIPLEKHTKDQTPFSLQSETNSKNPK